MMDQFSPSAGGPVIRPARLAAAQDFLENEKWKLENGK
jgi:hypothetical protein